MDWKLSFRLDSDLYAPLQEGKLTNLRLKNTSGKKMVVTQVLLRFDWMATSRFVKNCNIKVSPNKSVDLPDTTFTIHLAAPQGSHNFTPGISYLLLENDEWKNHEAFDSHGDFIEVKPLPKLDYSVFVSHSNSTKDKKIVKECREAMKCCGISGYFAEDDSKPGGKLWNKIAAKIRSCDAFLVLWTEEGAKSGDIREEIGILVGTNKIQKLVPIVENGIHPLGSLKSLGIEWIDYDPPNYHKPLSAALKIIMEWAKIKEEGKGKEAYLPPGGYTVIPIESIIKTGNVSPLQSISGLVTPPSGYGNPSYKIRKMKE